MKARPKLGRKPRLPKQLSGLRLVGPTARMRLEVAFNEWELLTAKQRADASRPWPRTRVEWFAHRGESGIVHSYRSTPLPREVALKAAARLSARLPLPSAACVDTHCWSHLAVVRYVDGRAVAFGCASPATTADAAELGFPIALVEGAFETDPSARRVGRWEGTRVHGHTDAEILAAPCFDRGDRAQALASAAAVKAAMAALGSGEVARG